MKSPFDYQNLGIWLLLFAFFLSACRPNMPQAQNVLGDKVKLMITEDGIYQVTRAELEKAGLEVDAWSLEQLNLTQAGTAVPIIVQEDTLLFYGTAPLDPYTPKKAYLLTTGEAGLPMAETAVPTPTNPLRTTIPQTIHLEEDQIYSAEARVDEQSDVWFWHELVQQSKFPLELEIAAIENDQPASMRINLWGFTYNPQIENDHDFDVIINGDKVGNISWDGKVYHTGAIDIPAGILQAGVNEIILDNQPEGASFLDIMRLNWIEIDYIAPATAVNDALEFDTEAGTFALQNFSQAPTILEITAQDEPALLTGWQTKDEQINLPAAAGMRIAAVGPSGYKTPQAIEPLRASNWRDTANQADLLIIAPDEFVPALEPLVSAREKQGLQVAVVPLAEIFDAFGYGAESPISIQEFVRYAVEKWQSPAPQYLLIVGDATSDYKGNLAEIPPNTVPSILVPVQFSGETVSDSRLVDIDGDARPEMAVGRWPVRTLAEVENLVARTLAYESGTAVDRALFAADDTEPQFAEIATRLAKHADIPDTQFEVLKGPEAAEVAREINAGAWLTTYVGHGSVSQWGKNDVFTLESVSELNGDTPPIVLQLTCLTGLFSQPDEASLSEVMLTHPQGPVLLVAATSLTLSSQQEPFAASLMASLRDPQIKRIGDAFQTAKLSLDINSNGLREISDTFSLLGDPSALIVRP